MANTNDYLKRYNQTNNDLVRPTTDVGSGDDYYKMAKDQEYGLLFDKEVSLENAKANALKYTQNQINAMGMGGTGYGSSMQSGLYNTYVNRLNEAQNDYANNVRNINLQEQQAMTDQTNDRFQSITTMLTQADSVASMNELLSHYEYGEVKDGEFVWGEKPEGMSDDDWWQMQYYYRLQKNALPNKVSGANGVFDYENSPIVFYDAYGNPGTAPAGKEWNKEVNAMRGYINSGDIKDGSYIALRNLNGSTIYVQYKNGNVYYATKADYESNGGYLIRKMNGQYTYTTEKPS